MKKTKQELQDCIKEAEAVIAKCKELLNEPDARDVADGWYLIQHLDYVGLCRLHPETGARGAQVLAITKDGIRRWTSKAHVLDGIETTGQGRIVDYTHRFTSEI